MSLSEHSKNFGGVYSLVLTPFKEDRSIDYDIYIEYVRWQEEQGAHNFFAVGGSSEMKNLTLEEREKLAALAVKHRKKAKVFATANLEPSWYGQLEEIKRIEAAGVDGLIFVTKGFGNDEERLVTYLTELQSHATVPVILYEYPGYQNHLISGNAYRRLVETGKFHAIKDTTCTMPAIKDKIAVQGDSCVLQANIPYLLEAYEAGARGVVATPTTCGTNLFRRMWDSFVAGDMEEAGKMHEEIINLDNALGGAFPATAKYLVNLQGIPMNWYTRSDQVLSPAKLKALRTYHDYAVRNGLMK